MATAGPYETPPSPADLGWVRWDALVAGHGCDGAPAVPPQYRLCSLAGCDETPVAAIRRGPSGARPPFWQPYCGRHAQARGVDETPGGLGWTAAFLSVAPARAPVPR
jgi:hypothetical protein